jgi:hypothetical protein
LLSGEIFDISVRLKGNILFNNPSDADWMPNADYQNLHIVQQSDGGYGTVPSLSRTHTVLPIATASPCPPADPIPVTSNSPTRSFTLGDHTVITVTVDEIMKIAVPATSFAENIDRLNQMWDDTSPYWKNDSVVKINTNSIVLIYWPDIFKKTGLWSAHKSNWTEWKVRVRCDSAIVADVILLSSSSSVTVKDPQQSSGQPSLPTTAIKCLIQQYAPAYARSVRMPTWNLPIGRDLSMATRSSLNLAIDAAVPILG